MKSITENKFVRDGQKRKKSASHTSTAPPSRISFKDSNQYHQWNTNIDKTCTKLSMFREHRWHTLGTSWSRPNYFFTLVSLYTVIELSTILLLHKYDKNYNNLSRLRGSSLYTDTRYASSNFICVCVCLCCGRGYQFEISAMNDDLARWLVKLCLEQKFYGSCNPMIIVLR